MKVLLTPFLVVACLAMVSSASWGKDIIAEGGFFVKEIHADTGAVFSVSPMEVDFGSMFVGTIYTDTVTVTNIGTALLNITSVSSDNSEFGVAPASAAIPPSTSADFFVTAAPTSAGSKNANITFVHNGSTSPDVIVARGTAIQPGFSVSPTSLDFGELFVSTVYTDTLTVTNNGPGALNIASVTSTHGEFSVTPSSGSLAASASMDFFVTFAPTSAGLKEGDIVFVHNGPTSPDSVGVRGTGLQPAFSVTPTSLDFGELFVSLVSTDTVTVTNNGNTALNITSVTSTHGEFSVTPTSGSLAASASMDFFVTFAPTSAGLKESDIVFVHDGPSSPDLVHVKGIGVDVQFSVTPANLDFGSLFVGDVYTDTVTVSNGGASTMEITSAASLDPNFTVEPSSGSVGPTSSMEFYISFAPTSPGLKSCHIVFLHNGPTSPDSVGVRGAGLQPAFSVTPTSLDFGELFVSLVSTDTVTVTNNGNTALNITSVTSTHGEFSVTPTSGSLAASASMDFFVTFAPTSEGLKIGDMVFVHNAATSPDSVAVRGTGIPLVLTIAEARALPNGTQVTIEGVLTRSLGAFSRIQDATGALSIRQASGRPYFDSLQSGALRPGDLVRMTGITSEFNQLKQFNQADLISFERITRDNLLPTPQVVTLAEIAANGEAYESELIEVTDILINPGTDVTFRENWTYQIEDPTDTSNAVTLRIPRTADSEIDGLVIPTQRVKFVGVLGQFHSSDPAAGYQLLAVDSSDITIIDGVNDPKLIPTVFALHGNYPNPFNPATVITFDVPQQTAVTLEVYNTLGQKVADLINNRQFKPGRYEVSFNATHLASGLYVYRLSTPEFSAVQKMLFVK